MAARPLPSPPIFQAPRFKPQCTHLTMTRLYGFEFLCDACARPGQFGWVYRCTQDQEDIIEDAVANRYPTTFDDLGETLTFGMNTRKRSAAARMDRLSFLEEITSDQLATYRPEQIATILRQREDVHKAIARDKLRDQTDATNALTCPDRLDAPSQGKEVTSPWVPDINKECRYTICPRCRPGAGDRTFLSLVGIAQGEVPPTAAVGYGFHVMGERPVVDANILEVIGQKVKRAVEPRASHSSSVSNVSIMDLLEFQLAQSQRLLESQQAGGSDDISVVSLALPSRESGRLKHSPRCDNLAAFTCSELVPNQGNSVRPPWTPPPSPSLYSKENASEAHSVGLAAERSISDGRSSNSLKVNQEARNRLLASVPSNDIPQRLAQCGCASQDKPLPYLDETEYDVGLLLPFNKEEYEAACQTPLGDPDPAEELFLNLSSESAQESKRDDYEFTPEPLKVDHGVAMLEESVELGVPDVITQL